MWGWGYDKKKVSWLKWKIVCKNKEYGGLGIKEIESLNKALLGMLKWRLGREEEGLWCDIINSKYGSWRSLECLGSNKRESRWWRYLRSLCEIVREETGSIRVINGVLEKAAKYFSGKMCG